MDLVYSKLAELISASETSDSEMVQELVAQHYKLQSVSLILDKKSLLFFG